MKNEEEIIEEIITKIEILLDRNEASTIASALVALGLKIYKTVLSETEYVAMRKSINKKNKNMKPFTERKLH